MTKRHLRFQRSENESAGRACAQGGWRDGQGIREARLERDQEEEALERPVVPMTRYRLKFEEFGC